MATTLDRAQKITDGRAQITRPRMASYLVTVGDKETRHRALELPADDRWGSRVIPACNQGASLLEPVGRVRQCLTSDVVTCRKCCGLLIQPRTESRAAQPGEQLTLDY